MASELQIAANKINAQKCCGPKTEETKAISSRNSFKTGIDCKSEVMRCESHEEHDELIASFQARFLPATPEEQSFVDALIRHEWLSRRYICVETGLWERRFTDWNSTSLGQVFLQESAKFSRAGQLFNAARRGFAATLKQLREAQTLRKKEPLPETLAVIAVATPETADDAIPSRDCDPSSGEGAVLKPTDADQNPAPPAITTKPLNPKLDSLLTFPNPAPTESEISDTAPNPTPQSPNKGENDPPIAA